MNRSDLERLITLGVSLGRDEAAHHPEFQALDAALRAEEEERERSKPENIRAEIQQCLEHACCRYLPAWVDQRRLRVVAEPNMLGSEMAWRATVDEHSFHKLPSLSEAFSCADTPESVSAEIVRVPFTSHGMGIGEPGKWLDEAGQAEIRVMCDRIGKALGERMIARASEQAYRRAFATPRGQSMRQKP